MDNGENGQQLHDGARYIKRVTVRSGNRIFLVNVDEVDWIEAADNYVRLHCKTGKHLVRATLTAFERFLDPQRFQRIHRSAIVNLDRIRELQPWSSGEYVIFLQDDTRLKLSRGFKDRFQQHLRSGVR